MRDAGFSAANVLTENIQEVKNDLKDVQTTVLEALAENQNMFSQAANHIGQQQYHDRRMGFILYEYIPDENTPLEHPSSNTATSTSQLTEVIKKNDQRSQ